MNSTIKQVSGPSQSTPEARGLPPAARKFAKQMGLDLSGLEAEAEDMWEMLTKMSVESPLEYEQFVAEQLKRGQKDDADGKNSQGGRMMRPTAGFSIKCLTTGNDGLKVREKNMGKDLYINMCSHEAIEPPKDKNSRPVLDDRLSADGLEIPMVIGPLRDITERAMAVDVIFHPVILSRSISHHIFRTQMIDLAIHWVGKESTVLFNPRYVSYDKVYFGGRGVEKILPVLLNIDEVIAKQDHEHSPSADLLDTIKQQSRQRGDERDGSSLAVNIEQHNSNHANIQVRGKSSKGQAAPAIKKGFLEGAHAKNRSIYPESGSSEGSGQGKGGAYSRLLDRCQVVDQASGCPLTAQAVNDPPSAQTTNTVPRPSKKENDEVDAIFAGLDDDWALASGRHQTHMNREGDMASQLAKLASVISGPDIGDIKLPLVPPPTPAQRYAIENHLPSNIIFTAETRGGGNEVLLSLNGVEKEQMRALDLQVSESQIILRIEGEKEHELRVTLAFTLDTQTVQAKMSKKTKSVLVTMKGQTLS